MPNDTTRSQSTSVRRPRSVRLAARARATAALFGALTAVGSAQAVLHVDADLTTGANDGSSWVDAYQGSAGLHLALAAAAPGDEIWLKVGTYRPSATPDVSARFVLDTDDVALRGGFEGTELSPLERVLDPGRETVLSGDLLGNDDGTPSSSADNSARVLDVAANGPVLEDLRITAGGNETFGYSLSVVRNFGAPATRGARIRRCVLDEGVGSGAAISSNGFTWNDTTTKVVDCTFRANAGNGLAMFSRERGIEVDRCWTVDNGGDGLVLTTNDFGPPVSNVVSARNGGRGIVVQFVDSEGFGGTGFDHCTVAFNGGYAIEVDCTTCFAAITRFESSIARGNNGGLIQFSNGGSNASLPSVINSLVQGVPGADADPRFLDPANGDYRPGPGSPAIDAVALPDGIPFDAARQYRAVDVAGVGAPGSESDLGALESTGTVGRHDECTSVPNSTGSPGRLFARGSDVATDNDLSLAADRLPANRFGMLLASRQRGFAPGVGGLGALCLGGAIGRFNGPGQILPTSAAGVFVLPVDLTALPQPSSFVAVQPGETWRFQLWHRDVPGPSQFSGVVTVAFR